MFARTLFSALAALCSFAALCRAATPEEALATWKSGNYDAAIPQLQALSGHSDCPAPACADGIRSALLSALVYEGHVDEATELANSLAVDFPNSPSALAARGEFYFYMADLGQAEKLFRAALKQKEETARAYYGLYRIYRAASYFKTARTFCLRAHAIDPDDSLITLAFLNYVVGEKRRELVGPFFAQHPWLAAAGLYEQQAENEKSLRQALAEHHAFEPVEGIKEADVPLFVLMSSGTRARGIGIDVAIGEGRPLRLMLDSGASGILLSPRASERAGLQHLGSIENWGIGDKGIQKGFFSVAETCRIGTIQYKSCVFRALEGKGRIADDDGLVGTDFFSQYVIHLDFQKRHMHLTPLPERPVVPQGYDRQVPPEEKTWTPIFRFGHMLCIPTMVNRKASGLFLLDSGSSASLMDSAFARLSTRIYSDDFTRIRGVSGSVKDVFEADKAELQFGHFRQNNLGLTAINLGGPPEKHQEFRLSGILGIPVLALFRLDLDYRNGLVNLDYAFK